MARWHWKGQVRPLPAAPGHPTQAVFCISIWTDRFLILVYFYFNVLLRLETHAESPKQEVLETHSFDIPGAPAFNVPSSPSPLCHLFRRPICSRHRETQENSHTAWGPTGPCHTGCKRISKYVLIGSAGNVSKFTNNCLVRCINCFHAKKKSRLQAGEDDADEGVRFMPALALVQNALPCYKFGWSLPEAESCWNIYQYAVTWQTPEGKAFYLKQRMIKILGWHICDIWKVFCHSH